MMRVLSSRNTDAVDRLLAPSRSEDRAMARRVFTILAAVRTGGDRALLSYAGRFDGLRGALEVSPEEIEEGASRVSREVRRAISTAARRIRLVARRQRPRRWSVSTAPGVTVEQRVTPLDRVGCYVPGGRYPLPSSLLMTVIPARAAGVAEVIVACPRPEPSVLAAAQEAGVLVRLVHGPRDAQLLLNSKRAQSATSDPWNKGFRSQNVGKTRKA